MTDLVFGWYAKGLQPADPDIVSSGLFQQQRLFRHGWDALTPIFYVIARDLADSSRRKTPETAG
jgi:hypothetical protein